MSKRFRYFITVDENTDNYIGEVADRQQLEQDTVASLLIKYAARGYTADFQCIDTPKQLLLGEAAK